MRHSKIASAILRDLPGPYRRNASLWTSRSACPNRELRASNRHLDLAVEDPQQRAVHDFIIPRTVPRTLMPCSPLRSRAFRRPPNCPRSRKRKRFSARRRREPVEEAEGFLLARSSPSAGSRLDLSQRAYRSSSSLTNAHTSRQLNLATDDLYHA